MCVICELRNLWNVERKEIREELFMINAHNVFALILNLSVSHSNKSNIPLNLTLHKNMVNACSKAVIGV